MKKKHISSGVEMALPTKAMWSRQKKLFQKRYGKVSFTNALATNEVQTAPGAPMHIIPYVRIAFENPRLHYVLLPRIVNHLTTFAKEAYNPKGNIMTTFSGFPRWGESILAVKPLPSRGAHYGKQSKWLDNLCLLGAPRCRAMIVAKSLLEEAK